jgi:hypothetical protein
MSRHPRLTATFALLLLSGQPTFSEVDTSQLIFTPAGIATRPAAVASGEYGPVFALNASRLAVWKASGWGSVALINVSNPAAPVHSSTISAPHRSYNHPSFGLKLAFSSNRLFISNPFTWLSEPHDGRIYAYNITNPQAPDLDYQFAEGPHTAGYFGWELTTTGEIMMSAQASNPDWDTKSGTFFHKVNSDGTVTLLEQKVRNDFFHPVGSAISGDHSAMVFDNLFDEVTPGECWVFRINRSGGVPSGVSPPVALPLSGSASVPSMAQPQPEGSSYHRVAMSGQLMAIAGFGTDAAANDNAVTVYRIDDDGNTMTVNLVATITPPPTGTSRFGRRLAFLGKRLFISDPQAPRAGTTAKGVVHICRIELDGTVTSEGTLTSQTNGATELFGEFLSADPALAGAGMLAVGVKLNGSSTASDHDIQLFDGALTTPEIELAGPATADLGSINTGGASPAVTFTINSVGTAALADLAVTKSGANPGDFTVTSPASTPIAPGGSTTFNVTLTPAAGASGPRTAVIHLANNDADENPLDITVTGFSYSTTLDHDADGMNDWAEFQLSGLDFDWQTAQPGRVTTYFAGANANGLYTRAQLQALYPTTPLIEKEPLTGLFKLTMGIEKSLNLTNYTPFPMTSPQTTINGQGKLEFRFASPENAAFFILRPQ